MKNNPKAKTKIKLASVKQVFKSLIWPRRKLLLFGLFLLLINRAAGLVLPGATKFLIDDAIGQKNIELLWQLVTAVGAAVFIQAATSFSLTLLLSVEAQQLISQLRVRVQKHVIRLPLSFFDNTKSGVLVSRIMTDVEGVRNLVGTGLVQLFGGTLTAIASFVILLNINAVMTVLTIIPMLVFTFISLKAFSFLRPVFRTRRKIHGEVTGRLTETLGGIRVIKGFNAENREERVFEKGVNELFKNVKKTMTTTSLVTALATLLMGITSALLMGFGGTRIIQESMTIGDFFAFTLYLGFMVAPIIQMSNIGTQLTEAFAGLDRTEEILSEPREGDDPKRKTILKAIKGGIHFSKVSFSYKKGTPVIRDMSLDFPADSVTALVGSSGSGKTTIAGLAASFLAPQEGAIEIDGIDLSTVNLESYRSRLGVVLQDEFLFDGTIRENIAFGNPGAGEAALQSAVASAHIPEFTSDFKEGLDTLIGERGVKLSGGQRQRVSIARAILADPKILILDEATSSLDMESESFIQEALTVLMKNRTTIVIAHRLSTIRNADCIFVVEKGKIEERGKHAELIEKKGRYFKLYTYQARI